MKKILGGLAGLLGVVILSGCAVTQGSSVYWNEVGDRTVYQDTDSTQTPGGRLHTIKRSVDQDAKSIIEDIDYVTLTDRPSRLSQWHER